jgi:hypothetical protein
VRAVTPLLVITGTTVAYIVIVLVVLRLIAGRVLGAWTPLFDGAVSILFGVVSIGFQNPAGVPVIGLAFAAAGFLRESRERRRAWMFVVLAVGIALCGYATLSSLHHANDDYHP